MSRQPTPRLDQLRALREARYARAELRQKEAQKQAPRSPDTAPARETSLAAPASDIEPKKAARTPAKKSAAGKAAAKPAAETKTATKKSAKKASKKKSK